MKNRKIIYLVILKIIILTSCNTVMIDVVHGKKNFKIIDRFYLEDVRVPLGSDLNRIKFSRNLIFSLKNRGFTVESWHNSNNRKEKFRYHILMEIFLSKYDSLLNDDAALTLFVSIKDMKKSNEYKNIRINIPHWNLNDFEREINIFNKIAEKF
jgi:hypothetical protein